VIKEEWNENDKIKHIWKRDNLIFMIEGFEDGIVKNRKQMNENGVVVYEEIFSYDGFCEIHHYDNNGVYRNNKPAIYMLKNDVVYCKIWYKNGHKYMSKFYKNNHLVLSEVLEGNTVKKIWYKNGKIHKGNNLPAIILYEDNNITLRGWYKNGKPFRKNNLPHFEYYNDNIMFGKQWIIDKYRSIREHYDDGKLICKQTFKNGEENGIDDLPSTIYYDENEVPYKYCWQRDGELFREDDKPNIVICDGNQIVSKKWFNVDEKLHRDNDLPAIISYTNGEITFQGWYVNGIPHRENDLPIKEFYNNGVTVRKEWYNRCEELPRIELYYPNGNKSKFIWTTNRNNDLPAIECYRLDGMIQQKIWLKDGVRHRDNNQYAVILYDENENIISGERWIDGIRQINFDSYVGNDDCNICYLTGENKIITKCNHIFCAECIYGWINIGNNSCPYCRQEL